MLCYRIFDQKCIQFPCQKYSPSVMQVTQVNRSVDETCAKGTVFRCDMWLSESRKRLRQLCYFSQPIFYKIWSFERLAMQFGIKQCMVSLKNFPEYRTFGGKRCYYFFVVVQLVGLVALLHYKGQWSLCNILCVGFGT